MWGRPRSSASRDENATRLPSPATARAAVTLRAPVRQRQGRSGRPRARMRAPANPEELPAAEPALGHLAVEQPTMDALRARYLDPLGLHEEPLLPYEHLVLSEIASHADREQAK